MFKKMSISCTKYTEKKYKKLSFLDGNLWIFTNTQYRGIVFLRAKCLFLIQHKKPIAKRQRVFLLHLM